MITVLLLLVTVVGSALLGLDVAIPSTLMGVGIAIDVMLATVSKFRDDDLSFRNWTLPIMATHIGLPAVGYYGFWGLSQAYPAWNPILGIIGALFVLLFLYEVAGEWIGYEPKFGISKSIGKLFGFQEDDSRRLVAIMAVSWDALWSGPAKAAQAVTGGWTDSEVGWSFLIAGLVVAIAAQMSLRLALWMRKVKFSDASKMASYVMAGMYTEASVIGGFGVLSFLQGMSISNNIYYSIGIAAVVMAGVFIFFFHDIWYNALDEAEEAIEGDEAVAFV